MGFKQDMTIKSTVFEFFYSAMYKNYLLYLRFGLFYDFAQLKITYCWPTYHAIFPYYNICEFVCFCIWTTDVAHIAQNEHIAAHLSSAFP